MRFNDDESLHSKKFYEDLNRISGLEPKAVDKFHRFFVEADCEEEFSVDQKREKFARRFTNYMEVKGERSSVFERSCFNQAPVPKLQQTLDLIHYFCLRVVDEIFEIRNQPYIEWVDLLFDENKISCVQAALISELVQRARLSLVDYTHDESDLARLLETNPHEELTARFAAELGSLKKTFPIKDTEIALFTEVAHALFYMKEEVPQRELFREFLERFIHHLQKSNVEIKNNRAQMQGGLIEKVSEEDPEMAVSLQEVPKIKLEANRYWVLRKFDKILDTRDNFSKCVDDLYDQGYLTFSAANSFLALLVMNREWSKFNFGQQLLKISERHHLKIDVNVLLDAAFPPNSPVR